ncbi:MAG: VCBS repeat-containing protein, partial [Planctomycetaceae bacterium]|nr:VCBS repeat-containing protein [Planctomycetaceae bacterium]
MPTVLFRNSGSAGFSPEVTPGIGDGCPYEVALVDLNLDGWLDWVYGQSNRNGAEQDNSMVVRLNNGDGTFDQPEWYFAGVSTSLPTGDINGDGFPDAIACGRYQRCDPWPSCRIFWRVALINDGFGRFASEESESLQVEDPRDHELVDIDLDSDLDLIVEGGGTLSVYLNDGLGVFSPPVPTRTRIQQDSPPAYSRCTYWPALEAADLNRDGAPELLVFGRPPSGSPFVIAVMQHAGGGSLRRTALVPLRSDSYPQAAAVDLGGENLDVIGQWGQWSTSSIWSMRFEPCAFASPTQVITSSATSLAAMDLNGDRADDLVFWTHSWATGENIAVNSGGCGVLPSVAVRPDLEGVRLFGDLNADGLTDLLIIVGPQLHVIGDVLSPDAPAAPPVVIATASTYSRSWLLADVDRDGRSDLVQVDINPGSVSGPPRQFELTVRRSNGALGFDPPEISPRGSIAYDKGQSILADIRLTDRTGDGVLDVMMTLIRTQYNGRNAVDIVVSPGGAGMVFGQAAVTELIQFGPYELVNSLRWSDPLGGGGESLVVETFRQR